MSLLTPSAIGVVLYSFLSALIIILHQFSFIERYLQVPQNVHFTRMFLDWLDREVNRLIGQSTTDAVVVGLFWAVVGLGVYIFLRGVARFIADLGQGLDERSYLWPQGVNRNKSLHEAVLKVVFRSGATIGLLLVVFGPLMRLFDGKVFVVLIGRNQVLQFAVWFILLWLMLHICVVLMRLIVLRPRIFG